MSEQQQTQISPQALIEHLQAKLREADTRNLVLTQQILEQQAQIQQLTPSEEGDESEGLSTEND